MKRIREAIKLGIFDSFRQEFLRVRYPTCSPAEAGHSVRVIPPVPRLMSLLDPFLLAMATPQQGSPNPWLQLIPFALILGIFYFVMVLPMRKRQQKVTAFLAALKVGDRVITTGGIFGSITTSERPVRAAAGRQQRAHRSLACGDRRISGAGPRRP